MGGGTVPGPETGYPSGGNAGVATQLDAGKPGPIAAKQGVQQDLTVSGWPRLISWDEFRDVDRRSGDVGEDAQIRSETIGGDVQVRESRNGWLIAEMDIGIEVDEDMSWVVTASKTSALLAHEQGHFDIHGIIAGRDIINRLRGLRERNQARLATAIRRTMSRQHRRGRNMTNRYDEDTEHGTNAERQTAWETEIERAINNNSSLRAPS